MTSISSSSERRAAAVAASGPDGGSGDHGVALWQQLQATAAALVAIRGGQSAPTALQAVAPPLRPGARALVFHVLRWLGRAEALRRKLAARTPAPLPDALLCTALALAWRAEDAPYEPFTLVDQTVEAAKRNAATRPQASFINACLRRFLREREELLAAVEHEPMAFWNHPRWWIEQLKRDHPRRWQDILRANNAQAPMTLRVNAQKTSRARVLQALDAMDIEADPVGDVGVLLGRALPVEQVPGFAEGQVSVQDAAAQLAAPLLLRGLDLDPRGRGGRPLRVLDACAAPGGKTAHLLEYAAEAAGVAPGGAPPIDVLALDIDPARCERIHQTLDRLGLSARVLAADARTPADWWPQHCGSQPFDAILLDAPCTASGIVRRQPDVRWLRRESDIAQLAIIQAGLLTTLWALLAPGGRLLYCTCSVFRAEGDRQIETFVAHNTDAVLLPSPGHLLPTGGHARGAVPDNPAGDHDGFFYALLQKRSA